MPQWITQSQCTEPIAPCTRFVARQPILDRMQRTFGYELLFRSGWENRFASDGESASREIIDHAVSHGIDSLVGDTVPFLNCTRQLLLKRLPTLLPRNTVLEILEDSEVDDDLVAACRELRSMGYQLAIDDFDFDPKWEHVFPLADFIKVDFRASSRRQRTDLLYRLRHLRIRFIAEKVETREELQEGLNDGFHLFQGYYFTRPVVLSRRSISAVVNKVRLLCELSLPTLDRTRLLHLVKEEPALSLRLMRMANSAAMAVREPIVSLRTALALVGDEQFRKLAVLAATIDLSGANALEPVRFILHRARFCELAAQEAGLEPAEMYLFGMLSVVCETLAAPVEELVGSVRLPAGMVAALNGTPNVFHSLLCLAQACETGDWEGVSRTSSELNVTEESASTCAVLAQRWVDAIMAVV